MKLTTMKRTYLYLVLAFGLLTACENGTSADGQLSGDLVTISKSASESSEKQAVITFDKTEHDFGTLLQGEVVTYSFHFTNTGNVPLLVSDVKTSCGCTIADFPRDPIAPGKEGFIKATYDSKGHHDFQSRSITVSSNTMPAKTVLRMKGIVKTSDQY